MSRITVASTAFLALAGAALLGGCADVSGSSAEVGKLQEQVTDLAARSEKLESTVETQRRQIAGLKDDIISIRTDHQELMDGAIAAEAEVAVAAAEGSEEGAMAAAGEVAGASPEALQRVLESEAGQKAIELHLKKANERRDKERWSRMVDGMVDRFAEQADLTDDQVGQMKAIMSKGTDQMRELWTGMRAEGEELTREERAQRMEEMRTKSTELRAAMDEDVKAALSAEQFDQYKEMSDRMGRFMGGGGGRRGGGGGGR